MDQLVNALLAVDLTQYHRGSWTADQAYRLNCPITSAQSMSAQVGMGM